MTPSAKRPPEDDKLPWYPFWVRDWLADTQALTLPERGAYRDLLDYQWLHGAVPGELPALAAIWRVPPRQAKALWARLADFFPLEDGQHRNRKLERVRLDQLAGHETASRRGRAGAAARWHKAPPSNASAMLEHSPTNAQQMAYRDRDRDKAVSVQKQERRHDTDTPEPVAGIVGRLTAFLERTTHPQPAP